MKVNGEHCLAFLDNGAQINTITAIFVEDGLLDVRPLSNLVGSQVTCVSLGNAFTQLFGYVVVRIQDKGVQGYDEDQIALVILNLPKFMACVPVILITPMIGCVVNVIKETEIYGLATPWVNAQVAYLLSIQ